MTTISKVVLFALGGLAAGWIVSSSGRGGTKANPLLPETNASHLTSKSAPRRAAGSTARMDVAACREVLAAAEDDRHPLLRRFEREQALRRWLELDATGALAEAAKDPEADFARELFEAWAELDPRAALDALNASSRELTAAVARHFFIALMNRDPAMAAEELGRPRWKEGKDELLGWSFHKVVQRQWMKSDPAAAIASFGPPGSKSSLSEAEAAMAEAWAEVDFPAAWAHFVAKGFGDDGFSMPDAMAMLAKGLLKGDPRALEIESAFEGSADPDASDPREVAAEKMAESNPQAALEWASSRPEDDRLRKAIEQKVASDLASSDPEAALALWEASGGSKYGWQTDSFLRESFAALAATDPAGAAGRVMELAEKERAAAMGGVLTRAFADDPAAAIGQCRAWLDDPELQPAVAKAWALSFSWSHGAGGRDPGPMLEAIPELNEAVDANVLSTWTKVDPEAAAGWIQERLEQGKLMKLYGEYSDEGILTDLAISRPEFTASWLLDLPDPAVQAKAADTLAANWSAFDPAAADAWIATLPAGPLRDAAEKGRASGKAEKDRSDPFAR
jgi:hypothetical protein